MKPAIHYAGEVRTARMRVLPGWAACCSGQRAERIRREDRNTYDEEQVTCKACLRQLQRQRDYLEGL